MTKKTILIILGIATIAVIAMVVVRTDKEQTETPEVKTTRSVSLYYYSEEEDRDKQGNVACSEKALVAVPREIPKTRTPLEDTLRLFLTGDLTGAERERGITTEYPLRGLELKSVDLKDGVLTLDILDPQFSTGGGSCRVTILRSQLEATAKQFPEVKTIKYTNRELFQP